jgi:hypothetical protein
VHDSADPRFSPRVVRFHEAGSSEGRPPTAGWLSVDAWDDGVPYRSIGRTEGGYVVLCHDLARFFVTDRGMTVDVHPEAGVEREHALEAFEQQVLPLLDQLAGRPALHASSVASPAGVVGFLGPSGRGKSTLAAFLSERWPLVSDDFLPVTLESNRALATPTSRRVRLREGAVALLAAEGQWQSGKLTVLRTPLETRSPLVRLYELEIGPHVAVEPMSRKQAYVVIANNLRRIDSVSPELLSQELDFIDAVTTRTTVCKLVYPRTREALDEVERAIVRDLSATRQPV